MEGFLNVTHAVSLNDTFWVKQANSDLCWNQASLHQNEFDQLISEAAFDGSVSSSELSTTSPEFGTDGNYAKCWVREENEIFSIRLAAGIFTGERTIPVMLDYFEKLGSGDAFRRMCILDALIFNPDRHYGNFGVLFNTDTMEPISICPVFDNNRSLFSDLDQEQLENPDWYLQKCKPMLGKDFLVTARGLPNPQIRSDLMNLQDFQFVQHERITAPQERLEALSEIVNKQIIAILE